MAIRRAAWEKWPGFDERLGRGTIINSGEENFAFFGLVSRGYRVVYNPRAIVAHAAPSTMGDIRRRHLIDLSAATAYMTFLFAEFPQHRRRLMRFVLDHFRKSPRDWRERRNPSYKILPRWREFLALLAGPFLYIKTRLFYHSGPSQASRP